MMPANESKPCVIQFRRSKCANEYSLEWPRDLITREAPEKRCGTRQADATETRPKEGIMVVCKSVNAFFSSTAVSKRP